MSEVDKRESQRRPSPGYGELDGAASSEALRLGQNVRFMLVAVGGGGVRIAAAIARQHLRHLETVAINCDTRVQGFEEFDRRIYLGPEAGGMVDTAGSSVVGGLLARAAEPVLQRIFEGVDFAFVVGSLGGGAGSGALPRVLETASQKVAFLTAFVVKPFACEGERRDLADRTLGRLPFLEGFVGMQGRGQARLEILDNETLVTRFRTLAFNRVAAHWSSHITSFLRHNYLDYVESLLETEQISEAVRAQPPIENDVPPETPTSISTIPLPPLLPAAAATPDVELTFEIEALPTPRPLG